MNEKCTVEGEEKREAGGGGSRTKASQNERDQHVLAHAAFAADVCRIMGRGAKRGEKRMGAIVAVFRSSWVFPPKCIVPFARI